MSQMSKLKCGQSKATNYNSFMKPLIEDKENMVNNTFSYEKGRAKSKLNKKKGKP